MTTAEQSRVWQRMRQACSHPSLVTKESVEDSKDALELRSAKSSNASSAHTSDADDLADLLGGISLQTRTCSLCAGPISANDKKNPNDLCTKCHDELKRYDRLKSSTKVKRTLQLLENIRRESATAMAAGKPPKKTIIFSQACSPTMNSYSRYELLTSMRARSGPPCLTSWSRFSVKEASTMFDVSSRLPLTTRTPLTLFTSRSRYWPNAPDCTRGGDESNQAGSELHGHPRVDQGRCSRPQLDLLQSRDPSRPLVSHCRVSSSQPR